MQRCVIRQLEFKKCLTVFGTSCPVSKTCWFKTLAKSDGGRGGGLKLVRLNIYLEKREDLININPLPLEYTLEFMEYFINLSYFDLSTRESGRCGVVTSMSVFQISNREGE